MFALYSVKFKKIKKNKQKNTETDPNSTKHFPTIKMKLKCGNPPWKLKLCRIRNKMSKWNKNKTYLNIQNYNICVDCSHKWSNWTTVCMSAFKVQWNNHPVCAVTWLKTATVREYILPHFQWWFLHGLLSHASSPICKPSSSHAFFTKSDLEFKYSGKTFTKPETNLLEFGEPRRSLKIGPPSGRDGKFKILWRT